MVRVRSLIDDCTQDKAQEKQKHIDDVKPLKKLQTMLDKAQAETCNGLRRDKKYFLLSREWRDNLSWYMEDYSCPRPEFIDNKALLCGCGDVNECKARFNVEAHPYLMTQESSPLMPVREELWELLKSHFEGKFEPQIEFRCALCRL